MGAQCAKPSLDNEVATTSAAGSCPSSSSVSVICPTMIRPSEQQQQQQASLTIPTITNPANAVRPELLGVSVHWLRHGLLNQEVKREPTLNADSKVYELEDLSHPSKMGIIRRKGQHVTCPMTNDSIGSAYVHALGGHVDRVGDATHMLSYTWGYTIGDTVDTLEEFCRKQSCNEIIVV